MPVPRRRLARTGVRVPVPLQLAGGGVRRKPAGGSERSELASASRAERGVAR